MVSLLKTFGRGILYVIGLPFFLVALVIFGAAGLIAFVVQLVMSIFYFFTGRKFFPDLPEDLQLRALLEGPLTNKEEEEPIPEPSNKPEEKPRFVYPFIEEEPMKEEPVNQDIPHEDVLEEAEEEEKEEEPIPLSIEEDSSKEEIIETTEEKEEEEIEVLETYVPRSSIFTSEEEEDTEDDNGVDIKYDL